VKKCEILCESKSGFYNRIRPKRQTRRQTTLLRLCR